MTPSEPDPPEDLPEEVTGALEACSDRQLRTTIDYARGLLGDRPSVREVADGRPGEELVSVEDHGAYTAVVVERTEETGAARGPVLYHVRWRPSIGDEGGEYRWHYLGPVHGEPEGE